MVHDGQVLEEGKEDLPTMVQNVQLTSLPPKLTQMDDPMINFTKEDARQVHHPMTMPW